MFCSAPSPFLVSGASPLRRLLPLMVVFIGTGVIFKLDHLPCALAPLAVKVCQLHFNVWLEVSVCIFSTAFHLASMVAALCSKDRPTNFQ